MKRGDIDHRTVCRVDLVESDIRLCEYGESEDGEGTCQDPGIFRVTVNLVESGEVVAPLEVELCGPHSMSLVMKALASTWERYLGVV